MTMASPRLSSAFLEERDELFVQRACTFLPQQRATADERIAEIAREIADIYAPSPPAPPFGSWA